MGFGLAEPPFFGTKMLNIFMEIQLIIEATEIYHFVSTVRSLSPTEIETEPEKLVSI
jgi:hypothetical protein